MHSFPTGLRSSPLSKSQFAEFKQESKLPLNPVYFNTKGDLDRKTSLRLMGKTDFFTQEIDEALLSKKIRMALHSAKDLPDPLPKGLIIGAITKGIDPSDSLVLHTENPKRIGTSSIRREEAVRKLYPDIECIDIRGTIHERLALPLDGVVIAEAALLRLNLNPKRIKLPGKTTPYQGQLAAVIHEDDYELKAHLASIDTRSMHRILHLGLTPRHFHFPVIRIEPRTFTIDTTPFTHIIFTSKSLVPLIPTQNQTLIAIGEKTAEALKKPCLIAKEETAEGVVELLKTLDLKEANILYPHSSKSREVISNFLSPYRHQEIIAYDPIAQVPYAPPPLDPFDEIIFTSPSTVDAFLEIYKELPKNKKLTSQGEMTSNFLKMYQEKATSSFF